MKFVFHKKLLFSVLCVLAVLNGLVMIGSRWIFMQRFLQLENQAVEENLLRAANAVRDEAETLGVVCTDWSVWDDSYRFIQDRNPEYIRSNLVDGTLVDLNLNAILYFNTEGEIVFSKAMNLEEQVLTPLPEGLYDYFDGNPLLWPPRPGLSLDGLLRLAQGPMLISIRPILTSEGEGPARGLLVMTRWFGKSTVAALASRTALDLDTSLLIDRWPHMKRDMHLEISAKSPRSIHGAVMLNDIEGRPAIKLTLKMNRDLFHQGRQTVYSFQWLFLSASVVSGLLVYVLLVISRERQLAAERSFRQAFEHTTDGLLVFDGHSRLLLANPASGRFLGFPHFDVAALGQACLKHSELGPLIKSAIAGAAVESIDLTMLSAAYDDEKQLRALVTVLAGDGPVAQDGVLITLQDITREKVLAQTKNEFIASVAHELKTPLSVILGYADLLIDYEYEDGEERQEFVKLIKAKAGTLEKVVNDLIQLGHRETDQELALETEIYDPGENVRQIVDSFRVKTRRHLFEIDLPQKPVAIKADRHRIGQVLDNLLSNAVKYSPQGGTIRVHLERVGEELLFCVSDQGIGLSAEQLSRVFDKFYRVSHPSSVVRGMGLGLNIARNIVEAHHGRIWLESSLGAGTRACFALPCAGSGQSDAADQ